MRAFESSTRPLMLYVALLLSSGCTGKTSDSSRGSIVDLGEDSGSPDSDEPVDSGGPAGDTGTEDDQDADDGQPPDTGEPIDVSPPYDRAVFRASHNSYSGEERGTIAEQLDAGVRQIEIDFHDNDYETHGFRVGHGSPGSEVDHEHPNPSSNALSDWLGVIADWSNGHPDHAPLNVLLNIKDDMTDNRSTREGSLTALNRVILDAFEGRLFWSRNLEDAWPTVDSLRGKVVVGLTGRETTTSRVAYVRDQGADPAVAINDHGQIIEVHKSETHNTLWYWTGQMQDDGTVIWWHHGRYDNGREPAIALNNHGRFVEIHRSDGDDDLWYWTGTIGPDGDLVFEHNEEFDTGVRPSVAFDDLNDVSFREIHRSPSDADQRWDWTGSVRDSDGSIEWFTHGPTEDDRFNSARSESTAGWVSVEADADGEAWVPTLLYSTAAVAAGRIRYAQIAFIDTNWGDPSVLEEASRFRSFESGQHSEASAWQLDGGISRMWKFDEGDADAVSVPLNFAATDEPLSSWYDAWATGAGAVE